MVHFCAGSVDSVMLISPLNFVRNLKKNTAVTCRCNFCSSTQCNSV